MTASGAAPAAADPEEPRRLALIAARGGSKRLPRKNVLPFRGRPLLSWSVEAALESCLFARVCVSTEDREIAAAAAAAGAEVLERPQALSSDLASVAEVCRFHLEEFSACGERFSHLFCLYPTAPLRSGADLQAMAALFDRHPDAQAVVAVTTYSHYPFQALVLHGNGRLTPFWPELVERRASSLPPLVAGNGSTYAIRTDTFLRLQGFLPAEGLYAYPMESWRSIDIDTAQELRLLEAVASLAP